MRQFFKVLPQYLVPHHLYTRLLGWTARCRLSWVKRWQINTFIRRYNVNMQDAVIEDPEDYPTFNSFFTRRLKPGLRPIVQGAGEIACPVDGTISQIGEIQQDSILQAKGFNYSLASLLGGNPDVAKPFQNGQFATIYLAPRDYHRIHMPLTGSLKETIYIPGSLFSVNQLTANIVPDLFARNERLVCLFETEAGPMALILVGAMIVGSIHTVWNDNPKAKVITTHSPSGIVLERGAEMGHFQVGSTVIVLFGHQKTSWVKNVECGTPVKMGQLLGKQLSEPASARL